jgi:tetratricopeptide (TPR) repeat protein
MKSDGTIVSQSGGYTPAYCSMEQMNGEKLTRRTDIYSWAVSVMEMYIGERPWANGVIAGAACESYFPNARITIPEAMKTLLKECLNTDEAQRPHDFMEIERRLLELYKGITGSGYGRTMPKAAADTADSLNNRALSFLDMNKPEEAEKCWKKALQIDTYHSESTYNYALYSWRNAKIDDVEAVRRVEMCHQNKQNSQSEFNLGRIHLERGDADSAYPLLRSALQKGAGSDALLKAIEVSSDPSEGWHVLPLRDQTRVAKSVCISPDGNYALSGEHSQYSSGQYLDCIYLWNIKTGTCIKTFEGHTDLILAVCFSPDGKLALSGSADKTIRLWDLDSYESVHTFI